MSNLKNCACFVPFCTNTTLSTPEKIFLNVPRDYKRRDKWFRAARRINPKNTSIFFCCEDHFDLKEDMENYLYYTIMGDRLRLKIGVVPHKFECQPNRKRRGIPRPASEKRQRQQMILDILTESTESIESNKPQEFITGAISVDHSFDNVEKVNVEIQTDIENPTVAVQTNSCHKYRSVSVQCGLPLLGVDKSCSPIKVSSKTIAKFPIKSCHKSILDLPGEVHITIPSCGYINSNSSCNIYEPLENSESR